MFVRRRVGLAAAAVVVAAAGTVFLSVRPDRPPAGSIPAGSAGRNDDPGAAVADALDWLVGTQEGDGSWNPVRWQGQENSRVGLTGMAVLAFFRHDPRPLLPARLNAADRAVEYLLSRQSADGGIGAGDGEMLCNHGIAACALIEAYGAGGREALRPPIGRALDYIAAQQLGSGGWGSRRGDDVAGTEISVWQLSALEAAVRCGLDVRPGIISRGVRCLTRMAEPGRRPGGAGVSPRAAATLTAMRAYGLFSFSEAVPGLDRTRADLRKALAASAPMPSGEADWHRLFFTASAARAGDCRELHPWLESLQADLVRRRQHAGLLAGSWDPEGPLSAVGGRLYATIMATLLLEPVRTSG